MEKIDEFFTRLKKSWSFLSFLLGFLFNFATTFFFPFKRDDFTFWIPLTATTLILGEEVLNNFIFGLLSFLRLLPYRPYALWTYYYLQRIFGSNAWGFHLFKAVFVGLSSVIVFNLSKNKSKSFFFIFNGITWCSSIWICDWEIMSQFFILTAVYCFEKRKEHVIYYPLMIMAVILGNLYKDSSKAIPVFILLYILIQLFIDRKFEKKDILDALVVLIITAVPVGIIFLTIPSISISINPANLIIFSLLTFAIGNEMLIKGFIKNEEKLEEEKHLLKNLLYFIWLFTVLLLSILIPAVEFRHLLPIVIPLILFMKIEDGEFPSKRYIGYIIGFSISWILGFLQVQYLLSSII